MDTMREIILVLEHTQENPIVVDKEETAVEGSESGEELEIEENKVAVVSVPLATLVQSSLELCLSSIGPGR